MSIGQERPPAEVDENLSEYLVRRFLEIGVALDLPSKFPPRKEMPYKSQVGDAHYFSDPVTHNYDAEITSKGFWGLTDDGWVKLSNETHTEKMWSFDSPAGSTGTFYFGGFYDFASGGNDFSPSVNFGTVNSSYAAHISFILGETTVDELTVRVTGTSITDLGVRTSADTEDVIIPDASVVDAYFETEKKFLGQVSISVQSGTAKKCNYGWSKYWDHANNNFTIKAVEATWLAGANDTDIDIQLIHHNATGWTYVDAGIPIMVNIASLVNDHGGNDGAINNEYGAWKNTTLDVDVVGASSEGTLFRVITTANKAFELGTLILTIDGNE